MLVKTVFMLKPLEARGGQNMSLAEGRQHMKYKIRTSQLMDLINLWLDSVKKPNTEIFSLQQLTVLK